MPDDAPTIAAVRPGPLFMRFAMVHHNCAEARPAAWVGNAARRTQRADYRLPRRLPIPLVRATAHAVLGEARRTGTTRREGRMRYGSHIRTGLGGAVLAVVVWLMVRAAPAVLAVARARRERGVGSASVLIDSNHLLIAAAIGFAAGWYWRVRRPRRRRRSIGSDLRNR